MQCVHTLRQTLFRHLDGNPSNPPLRGVGIIHNQHFQSLRNIPLPHPAVVLVASGEKQVLIGQRNLRLQSGELLLLPGGCQIAVGNTPGAQGEPYLAVALAFLPDSLEQFRRSYASANFDTTPKWSGKAAEPLVIALSQWVDWCLHHPIEPSLLMHRQVEILLLLAQAGLAGNLLLQQAASWRLRVAQLVSLDPAHSWRSAEVAKRLGVGESTLRRRLQEEQTNLRELLEESRLATALGLLQETFWSIGQVAEAVGYRSHSRFSERFKQRFGLTPIEVKKTRASESSQSASV